MPDKFYDYTAAGLPIINSLKGEVGQIIEKERIGINYVAGSTTELFEAFVLLIFNHKKRTEMADKSFGIGLTYDINNQINKLGSLIEKIDFSNNCLFK